MKKLISSILLFYCINAHSFTREEVMRLYENSNLTGSTVMLGDSITYLAPWNDLLSTQDIINRGISADTTAAILSRLHTIPKIQARRAFIMIGVNDALTTLTVEKIFSNYIKIIEILQSYSIEVIIQSTLRCNNEFKKGCPIANDKIIKLNELLKNYSKDKKIQFIDLNPILANTKEGLDRKYTEDGLHLNMLGYEQWANSLKGYF